MSRIDSSTSVQGQPATRLREEHLGAWDRAYLAFETPGQELRKFRQRLIALGARQWPAQSRLVELFCGRGSGLDALAQLGFAHVDGVDLSVQLLLRHGRHARLVVADCRALPYRSASKDIAIVQGGLHHLENLEADLVRTLAEVHRVLRPGGLFVVVEPWETTFLKLVHTATRVGLLRRVWPRLDALATMIEFERATYEAWLQAPDRIQRLLAEHFVPLQVRIGWGKLMFVGRKRD